MKSLTKKSTYNLVVNSEDRRGIVMEAAIYASVLASTIFGLWQFAAQTITPSPVAQNTPTALVARS